jgi:hypothetical protein
MWRCACVATGLQACCACLVCAQAVHAAKAELQRKNGRELPDGFLRTLQLHPARQGGVAGAAGG